MLYKDLTDGFQIADTLEYLSSIGGNPLTDFNTLGIHPYCADSRLPAIDTTTIGVIVNPRRPAWTVKTGYENRATTDNSYLIAESQSDDLNFYFKGQKRGAELETERRSIELKGAQWDAIIGNYSPDIGAGLGIGRYDYRPLSSPDDISDIIFPDNSYYNGLKIECLDNAAVLYSAKKFSDLSKSFYGAVASTEISEFKLGVTSSLTHLSLEKEKRNLGIGSVYLISPARHIKAEAAYAESGVGFFAESYLKSFKLKGWYYSKSYLNPQSSGYAYPDYKVCEPYNHFRFRQAQAGESGFYIARVSGWKDLILRSAIESWIVTKPSTDISLLASCPIKNSLRLNMEFSGRGGNIQERYIYEVELDYRGFAVIRALSNFWLSSSQIDHHKSFNQIYMMLPVSGTSLIGGRIKLRCDGQIEFFLEEKTILKENFYLKTTYRWRETDGRRLGPVYLVAECVI